MRSTCSLSASHPSSRRASLAAGLGPLVTGHASLDKGELPALPGQPVGERSAEDAPADDDGGAASYLITAMVSPVAIEPPSETPSSSTVPELGAVISFSIFIASITHTRAPSSISAPCST